MGVVVAMDGPSGSGKSSTSRGVAAKLALRYLDTGAMFRAMTWFMLREGVDVGDPAAVAAKANTPLIESGTNPDNPTITVDGTDVAAAIREQAVTNAVSPVSAVPEVRARLLELQRAAISEGGIVVEGRDIGVNIEDVHIDHDPGRPVGQVELVVEVERAWHLADALGEREWTVHL